MTPSTVVVHFVSFASRVMTHGRERTCEASSHGLCDSRITRSVWRQLTRSDANVAPDANAHHHGEEWAMIARAFDGAGRAQPRPGAQRRLRDKGGSMTCWSGSISPAS